MFADTRTAPRGQTAPTDRGSGKPAARERSLLAVAPAPPSAYIHTGTDSLGAKGGAWGVKMTGGRGGGGGDWHNGFNIGIYQRCICLLAAVLAVNHTLPPVG